MHPIESVLLHYYRDFPSIKGERADLNNFMFHKSSGLTIICPEDWPLIQGIGSVVAEATNVSRSKVLIIYNSTEMYDQITEVCSHVDLQDDLVRYMSWHEIFVAMTRSDIDSRALQDIKSRVVSSNLIIFVGASLALPDVVDWVKNFCSSCLMVLG